MSGKLGIAGATVSPSAPRTTSKEARASSRVSWVRPSLYVESVSPPGMAWGIVLAVMPAVLLFILFYAIPLGTVIVTAFANWSFRSFEWIGLANFAGLFNDAAFWKAAQNTLLYCAASVLVQVPLGIIAGILVAQRFWGWRFFRAALFIPVVISGPALALTFSIFYNPAYGLLNTVLGWVGLNSGHDWLFNIDTALPAVIATYVFNFGFVMILVGTETASIPKELYEAAALDGATWLQRELAITVPLLRQIAGTCVLLTLLETIKLFDVVYIMTRGGPGNRTATLGTYAYDRYLNDQWGYANAVGVLTIIVGFALIASVRRVFRMRGTD
jgi:raffinose/stachyose/melibiose transport system permease protein